MRDLRSTSPGASDKFHAMQYAVIVSIHDVAPDSLDAAREWCRLLDGWGIKKRCLAVIPFLRQRPVQSSSSLVDFLKAELAADGEVVLHGYSHQRPSPFTLWHHRLYDRFVTRGEAEFAALDSGESVARLLREGRRELEEALGISVRGFTAPCWWQSRATTDMLRRTGFLWYDTLIGIVNLRAGRRIFSPVITGLPPDTGLPALLAPWATGMMSALCRARVLRLALHPYDLSNPRFMRYVERRLRRWDAARRCKIHAEVIE